MTQEEKRIKIAEACGWTDCHKSVAALVGFPTERKAVGIPPNRITHATIPDYFNDLNACHEMEKTIPDDDTPSGTWGYIGHLVDLTGAESLDAYREAFVLAHATAAQRAEAFGLTMGLWKEGE